MQVKKHKIISR